MSLVKTAGKQAVKKKNQPISIPVPLQYLNKMQQLPNTITSKHINDSISSFQGFDMNQNFGKNGYSFATIASQLLLSESGFLRSILFKPQNEFKFPISGQNHLQKTQYSPFEGQSIRLNRSNSFSVTENHREESKKENKFNYWEKNIPNRHGKLGFKNLNTLPSKYNIFNCYDDVEETDPQIFHQISYKENYLENLSLAISEEITHSQLWEQQTGGENLIDSQLTDFFSKLAYKVTRNTKGLSKKFLQK